MITILSRLTLRALSTLIVLLLLPCTVFAQSTLNPPTDVSALLYSTNAAELFWTPTDDLVEVSRNGEVLGLFDARSLFQPELNSSDTYHYQLRTVNSAGEFSASVIVSLTTRDFSLPIKRVQPIGQDEEISPPPPDTSADLAVAVPTDVVVSSSDEVPQASSSVITQTDSNCIARDINSLSACVDNANAYDQIDLANDITCDGNCCPNGAALVRLNSVQNLTFAGHGHRLLRASDQRQCSLIDINNASNIQFNDIQLDDDQRVSGCQVADNCARMVHVKGSWNIGFDNTHISHGKGYAVYVQGTNGFRFERSSLHNSGVLGMYIGHGNDASTNVQITQSTFSDNQTNGLALLGVTGQSVTTNVVAENVFVRNHRRGQWSVAAQYGTGFTGGGQLYVAEASNVTVRNNVIKDGYCDNCYVQRVNRSGVSGIELGRPNQQSLSNVVVRDNTMLNLDGFGISQNNNSNLTQNVSIENNVLLNTTSGEHLQGASKSGNKIINTQHFDSFEDSNDVGQRFQASVNCSSAGSVTRQCNTETRYGQCAVQLSLAGAECDEPLASLVGPKISINAGQMAVASGWVRAPLGRWCTVFRDSSDNVLNEQCEHLNASGSSDVQLYVGLPAIQAIAPGSSASVQLLIQHGSANSTMWLDDLKLSVGNAL